MFEAKISNYFRTIIMEVPVHCIQGDRCNVPGPGDVRGHPVGLTLTSSTHLTHSTVALYY